MIKKILPFILLFSVAHAGFPPTTSKVSGDSNNVTTFNYQFPNFAGTHTGTTVSLGILGIAGGGTGAATTSQNFAFIGPTSGSGAPSFRLLTSGDIPSLSSVYCALAGCTMSGQINMGSNKIVSMLDPTSAQDAATKNYVDTQLLQLNPAAAVYAASTANIPGTYTNAVGGVCIGDTFTITATGALSIDGVSPPITSRILLKNQSSGFQNGVWTVTVAGTTGVSPILTRALDFDTSPDLNAGSIVPVINGTVNAGSSWYQTAAITTCSSDSQTWTQFQAASGAYLLKVSNLSDVASKSTSFNNLSPMTTTGDLTYENSSPSGTRLAIGSTNNALIVSGGLPAWGQIALGSAAAVSGQLTVANGGTGLAAITAHNLIIGNGTSAATLLAPGTTGFALTSAGASADPAWTAVLTNPMTTAGDMIYGGASGVPTRIVVGTSGQVPISAGATVAFGTLPGNATALKAPSVQKFTSSSGTYTTPTSPGPLYIRVRMVGGGGGGGGSGNINGTPGAAGGAGGNTTFGTTLLVANGGTGATAYVSNTGPGQNGTGGTGSLGSGPIGTAISGGSGGGASGASASGTVSGGVGGSSYLGGAGAGISASSSNATQAGGAAIANSGSGGGGAAAGISQFTGAGGGAGGYVDAVISAPSATYAYAVGASGTAGVNGTSGSSGGAGGSGYIEVTEYYQ